jgi:hypothetical protein
MKPTFLLEITGSKAIQFVVVTITSESDSNASYASNIGEGGVSAQTTKPTKTIVIARRTTIINLNLRFKRFHIYYFLITL